MNTVTFTFEDLCAFFTSNPSRLMVGLISTEGEAAENVHKPIIVIKRNGITEQEYLGFAEVNGDIALLVYPDASPVMQYAPHGAGDARQSFSTIVDIERDLYPKETLNVDAGLCPARIHFGNGKAYTLQHIVNAKFADLKTKGLCESAPSVIASLVGLEIRIPDGGYAVLHFDGQTPDFVFESGPDYEVEVANRAEGTYDHFRYFYNIVRPKPERIFVPVAGELLSVADSRPVMRVTPDVPCMPAKFGATPFFDFIAWLLGLSGGTPK